ncbi:hypothetical protein [Desulfovibrio desulfuricans]|uniref:hypothetical protein n=1 Tax=Desulfovibrio desulfuricans TaxID=876 RepID=UPI0035B30B68
MTKEYKYFNCEEDYEHDFVAGRFEETRQVKKWLKKNCENNNINNTTHLELYQMLIDAGFTMKDI